MHGVGEIRRRNQDPHGRPTEEHFGTRFVGEDKEARTLFYGGVTPLGAMTFVGKEWDGVRAVPATPVTRLGGSRPIYHGEHREITGDRGTLWHKVTGPSGVVSYACPEAALVAAKDAKQAMIDWKFR